MGFDTQIKNAVDTFFVTTSKLGVTVARTPVTKTTSNTYGDETLTTGTVENIVCYFTIDFKKTQRFFISEAGEIEAGDAFIMVKSTQALNKNDIITFNSRKYRVADIYRVMVNGTLCAIQGNCFLIE